MKANNMKMPSRAVRSVWTIFGEELAERGSKPAMVLNIAFGRGTQKRIACRVHVCTIHDLKIERFRKFS